MAKELKKVAYHVKVVEYDRGYQLTYQIVLEGSGTMVDVLLPYVYYEKEEAASTATLIHEWATALMKEIAIKTAMRIGDEVKKC